MSWQCANRRVERKASSWNITITNTHAITFIHDLCLSQARKEFEDLCPHEGCWWQIVVWEGEKCRRDELEMTDFSSCYVWERCRKSMKFSRGLFPRVSTRCLEITRGVHGPPWARIAPSPLYCSWYNHMELGFCDLGSKLASDSSSNIILFLRDVEDLLTSHPSSSMNSHLDVLVASYKNELITCTVFCKITLI